jgi:NADPH:quinone reductase-like Zn-dependent oxidoreductase
MEKVKLQAGETVLIQAAGSGVGSAAIQIAKSVGAKVITTVGEDWKIAEAKKLGADEVINYKKEDFERKVRELTEGRGVDVAFEHIGPEVFVQSMRSLALGGRLVTCGSSSGPDITLNLRALFSKNVAIFGNYMGSLSGFKKAVQWAEEGKLRPIVGKTFSLEQTGEAQECMESRNFFGKIVVMVS